MECRYNSIQTLGTVDGPGVRCILFLQGCPLRCGYCHNPETRPLEGGITATVNEIFERVLRCRNYFGKEGGLTVSGGEPLLQAEFVRELFIKCHENGINTCLDTSGCIINDKVEALLSVTDTVLLDIKMTNDNDYRRHIGCGIENPLKFLELTAKKNVTVWIRQVIVPGVNATEENIALLNDMANRYDNVKLVELLPFRKLCKAKYEQRGEEFVFDIYDTPTKELMASLNAGLDKGIKE